MSNPPSTERRAAVVAVITGAVLMAVKFVAWRVTDSSAVFGDAMESIVNVVASALAMWAIWQAHRPADRTHPYGHGKFEFVSASVEGALVVAAAVSIVWQAVGKLWTGAMEVHDATWGAWLVGITVLANGAVGLWLMAIGARSGSAALKGDGKHLLVDALTSLAAVGALLAVHATGVHWVDPAVAIVMAAVVALVGLRMVRNAFGDLVDEQDAGDYKTVSGILDSHVEGNANARAPLIRGWHKLRTRHLGRHHWVDFHIQVPGTMDVRTAHEVASAIEIEIEARLGGSADASQPSGGGNATAHIEPEG